MKEKILTWLVLYVLELLLNYYFNHEKKARRLSVKKDPVKRDHYTAVGDIAKLKREEVAAALDLLKGTLSVKGISD